MKCTNWQWYSRAGAGVEWSSTPHIDNVTGGGMWWLRKKITQRIIAWKKLYTNKNGENYLHFHRVWKENMRRPKSSKLRKK